MSFGLVGQLRLSDLTGAFCGEATPVPIPNTEVKLSNADDTNT